MEEEIGRKLINQRDVSMKSTCIREIDIYGGDRIYMGEKEEVMRGKGRLPAVLLVATMLCAVAGCGGSGPAVATAGPGSVANVGPGLHVVGNQIMRSQSGAQSAPGGASSAPTTSDAAASTAAFVYHGVNRSGTEYKCTQKGGGTFDGPSDQTSISAMLSWKITIVRVPLNEDCWLGINGEPANGTTAAQYQQDIVSYVKLLRQNNLAVILDLHWNAAGNEQALGQQPMPDLDHAPAFWSGVATTFKADPFVVFDLYNEPYTTDWHCWQQGSTGANVKPCRDVNFAVAGMQTLVNTVRATGAGNLILIGGLAYANNMFGWAQFKPNDPGNNLAASFHIYPNNGCNNTGCLDSSVAPVAEQYPVIAEEIGEMDCADQFITNMLPWFDSHHIGYLAWAWDTHDCAAFPALIGNYDGTATAYGMGFKRHLSSL